MVQVTVGGALVVAHGGERDAAALSIVLAAWILA